MENEKIKKDEIESCSIVIFHDRESTVQSEKTS